MDIAFFKMHGTLNDFVVFHDFVDACHLSPDQAAHICDRRDGVGADGVIVVRGSNEGDFFMDYVNADGSLAEMCGNGIRCLAKYVYDNGLTNKQTLHVATRAGVKRLRLYTGQDGLIERVTVDMGAPIFDAQRIPIGIDSGGSPILQQPVAADGQVFHAAILSMGNPHCVIVTEDDVESLPQRYGPIIEVDPLFPARTNVEFVRVVDRSRIEMQVWERGSGITLSCGTGACASAVAAQLKGLVGSACRVDLLGGSLEIEWSGMDNPVLMTGPCVTTFTGTLTL